MTTQQTLNPLTEEAQRRGYLTIDGDKITYHCNRDHKEDFSDPEEKVRACTYSWLIIERSYSPKRIKVEVTVPRRTPSDRADIIIYKEDACQNPYLVVENKAERCTTAEQRQAIEQGFGNANSIRAPYMLFDYGRGSTLFDVSSFAPTERIQNILGTRDALQENYGTPNQYPLIAGTSSDIAPVLPTELETKVRRAHGLIWASGKRDPVKSFDEWSKLLFAKIYDERHTPNNEPRKFQCGVGETDTQIANRIRQLFTDARQHDQSIFGDPNIDLPDSKIRDVVRVVQDVGLSLMPVDGLGHAFEHFFSSIFRGDLGQYFTRRELVRFMVGCVNPTDRDFCLDPTVGSGGFLLEILLYVWHQIAKNYAGQSDTGRREYDFAHQNLYGIEIHDILARVCKTNLLLHKDGHTNIESDRSCLDSDFDNPRIKPVGNLFTLLIGNPPFGDKVKEDDTDVLGKNHLAAFEMGKNRKQVKSELIVLERAFEFLRSGGRLAMVVPDGILNNPGEASQCPAFRRYLLRTARIDGIVSLPDYTFRKSGAQNKTSILFATKYTIDEKRSFDREYNEALVELRQTEGEVGEAAQDIAASSVVSEEEEGEGQVSRAALSEALLDAKAIEAVIKQHDYPIFIAEAEHIGYTPSGAISRDNDLYSIKDSFPDPDDLNTIVGQYRLFQHNRAGYQGSTEPECISLHASALFTSHRTYRMDPKFHVFERERLVSPPPGMKLVKLGDVLTRREERIDPATEPDEEFLVLTLSQEGELSPREPGQGKNPPAWYGQYFTGGSRWFRTHEDDLIYSQIDLWKGCVTIIPIEYDKAIATQEFPIYKVNKDELDPHYLKLVLRSTYFQRAIRAITTGHSNRRRTQWYDFEDLTIFVPEDMDVQRRISDAVRDSERAVAAEQRGYRRILTDIDGIIMGETRPDVFLRVEGDSVA